jgi:pyruvate dehydrogenase E1 component
MYEEQESIFYYLTVMNENYPMPEMPEGVKDGIVKGCTNSKSHLKKTAKEEYSLFGSGTILNEVIKAQEILEEDFNIAADVWSVTSYKELRREALEIERWNFLILNKEQKEPTLLQY